jgi:dCMP deaminase
MKTKRISREQALMEMAISASRRSTCQRRDVGALIAIDGRPVVTGYSGAPSKMIDCLKGGCILGPDGGCIRTVHAEANAIVFAARKGIACEGGTLYTTLSPCPDCANMIINAGITRVWYLEPYRIVDGITILREMGIGCDHLLFDFDL